LLKDDARMATLCWVCREWIRQSRHHVKKDETRMGANLHEEFQFCIVGEVSLQCCGLLGGNMVWVAQNVSVKTIHVLSAHKRVSLPSRQGSNNTVNTKNDKNK
jgi:hypothetical protein